MQALASFPVTKGYFYELTLLTKYDINLNKNLTFFWLQNMRKQKQKQQTKNPNTIMEDN